MAMLIFGIKGYSFKYLWPEASTWNDQSLVISLACIIVFAGAFTRSFLMIPQHRPWLSKILEFHIGLGVVCGILAFVLPYRLGITSTILVALSAIIWCLIIGIVRWRDRCEAVRYYLTAWSFMLGGGAILAMNKFGIVPNNVLTQNAAQIGSAIEVVLLFHCTGQPDEHRTPPASAGSGRNPESTDVCHGFPQAISGTL